MFGFDTIIFILLSATRIATPLILGALGGLFSERSGVINIAIEGMMLMGAFAAVAVSYFTGNPWLGVLGAMAAGGLFALIHAVICVTYQGNQTISGTAINIMGMALTIYLMRMIFHTEGTANINYSLPRWGIGIVRFNPITYFAFILVGVAWFVMYKTKFGLHVRSVGEHPAAADTMGISVEKIRYYAVIISGILAGMAGASLSIGEGSFFVRGMSGGRGFMALAIMIIGKWHPLGVVFGAFLFAIFEALQISIAVVVNIPSQIVQMTPYVVTLLTLVGFMGRFVAPAAIGKPYVKGGR